MANKTLQVSVPYKNCFSVAIAVKVYKGLDSGNESHQSKIEEFYRLAEHLLRQTPLDVSRFKHAPGPILWKKPAG